MRPVLFAIIATALARWFGPQATLGALMEKATFFSPRELAVLARTVAQARAIGDLLGRDENHAEVLTAGFDAPLVFLAKPDSAPQRKREAIILRKRVRPSDLRAALSIKDKFRRLLAEEAVLAIQAGAPGFIARTRTGRFLGAVAYSTKRSSLEIEQMASTGVVRGVGSALVRKVGRQALSEKKGLGLWSDPSAEGFYKHLGFKGRRVYGEMRFLMDQRRLEALVLRGTKRGLVPDRAFKLKPRKALNYFLKLNPGRRSTFPSDWLDTHRRKAFTLAEATDKTVRTHVHGLISSAIDKGDVTTRDFRVKLDDLGVTSKNPQYAEMVFRTNTMDAYNDGYYNEVREDPDLGDYFPYWEYLVVDDDRLSDEHRERLSGENGPFYPASRSFDSVRGDRVFNCRCSFRWVDKYEAETLGLTA